MTELPVSDCVQKLLRWASQKISLLIFYDRTAIVRACAKTVKVRVEETFLRRFLGLQTFHVKHYSRSMVKPLRWRMSMTFSSFPTKCAVPTTTNTLRFSESNFSMEFAMVRLRECKIRLSISFWMRESFALIFAVSAFMAFHVKWEEGGWVKTCRMEQAELAPNQEMVLASHLGKLTPLEPCL